MLHGTIFTQHCRGNGVLHETIFGETLHKQSVMQANCVKEGLYLNLKEILRSLKKR